MANRAYTHSGKISAKSVAFVLPTPVPRFVSVIVGLGLRFLNRIRAKSHATAKQLSFISFLHWTVVSRKRFVVGRGPSDAMALPSHDYNLFLSTFDGPWQPYVDAFADVLGHAIDFVWSFSEGYPGARPDTNFQRYIHTNLVEADHHYVAYPGAAVRDVRRALHLHGELARFAETSGGLEDIQFLQEFRRLLIRVQNDLGSMGLLPVEDSDVTGAQEPLR